MTNLPNGTSDPNTSNSQIGTNGGVGTSNKVPSAKVSSSVTNNLNSQKSKSTSDAIDISDVKYNEDEISDYLRLAEERTKNTAPKVLYDTKKGGGSFVSSYYKSISNNQDFLNAVKKGSLKRFTKSVFVKLPTPTSDNTQTNTSIDNSYTLKYNSINGSPDFENPRRINNTTGETEVYDKKNKVWHKLSQDMSDFDFVENDESANEQNNSNDIPESLYKSEIEGHFSNGTIPVAIQLKNGILVPHNTNQKDVKDIIEKNDINKDFGKSKTSAAFEETLNLVTDNKGQGPALFSYLKQSNLTTAENAFNYDISKELNLDSRNKLSSDIEKGNSELQKYKSSLEADLKSFSESNQSILSFKSMQEDLLTLQNKIKDIDSKMLDRGKKKDKPTLSESINASIEENNELSLKIKEEGDRLHKEMESLKLAKDKVKSGLISQSTYKSMENYFNKSVKELQKLESKFDKTKGFINDNLKKEAEQLGITREDFKKLVESQVPLLENLTGAEELANAEFDKFYNENTYYNLYKEKRAEVEKMVDEYNSGYEKLKKEHPILAIKLEQLGENASEDAIASTLQEYESFKRYNILKSAFNLPDTDDIEDEYLRGMLSSFEYSNMTPDVKKLQLLAYYTKHKKEVGVSFDVFVQNNKEYIYPSTEDMAIKYALAVELNNANELFSKVEEASDIVANNKNNDELPSIWALNVKSGMDDFFAQEYEKYGITGDERNTITAYRNIVKRIFELPDERRGDWDRFFEGFGDGEILPNLPVIGGLFGESEKKEISNAIIAHNNGTSNEFQEKLLGVFGIFNNFNEKYGIGGYDLYNVGKYIAPAALKFVAELYMQAKITKVILSLVSSSAINAGSKLANISAKLKSTTSAAGSVTSGEKITDAYSIASSKIADAMFLGTRRKIASDMALFGATPLTRTGLRLAMNDGTFYKVSTALISSLVHPISVGNFSRLDVIQSQVLPNLYAYYDFKGMKTIVDMKGLESYTGEASALQKQSAYVTMVIDNITEFSGAALVSGIGKTLGGAYRGGAFSYNFTSKVISIALNNTKLGKLATNVSFAGARTLGGIEDKVSKVLFQVSKFGGSKLSSPIIGFQELAQSNLTRVALSTSAFQIGTKTLRYIGLGGYKYGKGLLVHSILGEQLEESAAGFLQGLYNRMVFGVPIDTDEIYGRDMMKATFFAGLPMQGFRAPGIVLGVGRETLKNYNIINNTQFNVGTGDKITMSHIFNDGVKTAEIALENKSLSEAEKKSKKNKLEESKLSQIEIQQRNSFMSFLPFFSNKALGTMKEIVKDIFSIGGFLTEEQKVELAERASILNSLGKKKLYKDTMELLSARVTYEEQQIEKSKNGEAVVPFEDYYKDYRNKADMIEAFIIGTLYEGSINEEKLTNLKKLVGDDKRLNEEIDNIKNIEMEYNNEKTLGTLPMSVSLMQYFDDNVTKFGNIENRIMNFLSSGGSLSFELTKKSIDDLKVSKEKKDYLTNLLDEARQEFLTNQEVETEDLIISDIVSMKRRTEDVNKESNKSNLQSKLDEMKQNGTKSISIVSGLKFKDADKNTHSFELKMNDAGELSLEMTDGSAFNYEKFKEMMVTNIGKIKNEARIAILLNLDKIENLKTVDSIHRGQELLSAIHSGIAGRLSNTDNLESVNINDTIRQMSLLNQAAESLGYRINESGQDGAILKALFNNMLNKDTVDGNYYTTETNWRTAMAVLTAAANFPFLTSESTLNSIENKLIIEDGNNFVPDAELSSILGESGEEEKTLVKNYNLDKHIEDFLYDNLAGHANFSAPLDKDGNELKESLKERHVRKKLRPVAALLRNAAINFKNMGIIKDEKDIVKMFNIEKFKDMPNQNSEIYAQDSNTPTFVPISEMESNTLSGHLNKAFGGAAKVTNSISEFNKRAKKLGMKPVELSGNDGTVYGAVLPDGTIYINPKKLNANTPIHEHTHLFNNVIRKINPKLWNRMVNAIKDTEIWNDIKNDVNYSNLKTDNQIADEAYSRLVGNKGEVDWQKRIEATNNKSLIQTIKDVIKEYWDNIKDFFGVDIYKGMDSEDFANLTLKTLFGGKEIVGSKEVIEREELTRSMESIGKANGGNNFSDMESDMYEVKFDIRGSSDAFENSLANNPYKEILNFSNTEDIWKAKVLSQNWIKLSNKPKSVDDIDNELKRIFAELTSDENIMKFTTQEFSDAYIDYMASEENSNPESRRAFELMRGNQSMIEKSLLETQKEQLKGFKDYISSLNFDTNYSVAFKILAINDMLRFNISYSKKTDSMIITKRSKSTVSDFTKLSEGFLSLLNEDKYSKSSNSLISDYLDMSQNFKPELSNLLSDAKPYIHQIKEDGVWYKFDDPNNEDAIVVSSKFSETTIGQKSSWCTTSPRMSKHYIQNGSLYIYYSNADGRATLQLNFDKYDNALEIGGNNVNQSIYEKDISAIDEFKKSNPQLNLREIEDYNFYYKLGIDVKKGRREVESLSMEEVRRIFYVKEYKKDNTGILKFLKEAIPDDIIMKAFNAKKILREYKGEDLTDTVFVGESLNLGDGNEINLDGFTFLGNSLHLGHENKIKDLKGFIFLGSSLYLGDENKIKDLNGFTFKGSWLDLGDGNEINLSGYTFEGGDLYLGNRNKIKDLNGFTFKGESLNLGDGNKVNLDGFTFKGTSLDLGNGNKIKDLNGFTFKGSWLDLGYENEINLSGFTFNGRELNLGDENKIKDLNGFTFKGSSLNLGYGNKINLSGFTFLGNSLSLGYGNKTNLDGFTFKGEVLDLGYGNKVNLNGFAYKKDADILGFLYPHHYNKIENEETVTLELKEEFYQEYDEDGIRYQKTSNGGTINGFYDKANRVIGILETGDSTTLIHELGHFFKDILEEAANNGNTKANSMLKEFESYAMSEDGRAFFENGLKSKGGEYSTKNKLFMNELWSYSLERYFREGAYASGTMTRGFKNLLNEVKAFFKEVYKNARSGILGNIKLSEKMKDVFEDIVGEKYNSNYDFMQYIKTTFNKISKDRRYSKENILNLIKKAQEGFDPYFKRKVDTEIWKAVNEYKKAMVHEKYKGRNILMPEYLKKLMYTPKYKDYEKYVDEIKKWEGIFMDAKERYRLSESMRLKELAKKRAKNGIGNKNADRAFYEMLYKLANIDLSILKPTKNDSGVPQQGELSILTYNTLLKSKPEDFGSKFQEIANAYINASEERSREKIMERNYAIKSSKLAAEENLEEEDGVTNQREVDYVNSLKDMVIKERKKLMAKSKRPYAQNIANYDKIGDRLHDYFFTVDINALTGKEFREYKKLLTKMLRSDNDLFKFDESFVDFTTSLISNDIDAVLSTDTNRRNINTMARLNNRPLNNVSILRIFASRIPVPYTYGMMDFYNLPDYLNFFDGIKDDYSGALVQNIFQPLKDATDKHQKIMSDVMSQINAYRQSKEAMTNGQFHRVGIRWLLSQRTDINFDNKWLEDGGLIEELGLNPSEIITKMALKDKLSFLDFYDKDKNGQLVLKNAYDEDLFMLYEHEMNKRMKYLRDSIMISFGEKPEDSGLTDADMRRLMSEMTADSGLLPSAVRWLANQGNSNLNINDGLMGVMFSEIARKRKDVLSGTGFNSIKELIDNIQDDSLFSEKENDFAALSISLFDRLNNGEFSNGVTMQEMSDNYSGSTQKFFEVGNYAPIVRYFTATEEYEEGRSATSLDELSSMAGKPPGSEAGEYYTFRTGLNVSANFLKSRTKSISAINTNAFEMLEKKFNQELFYMLNEPHRLVLRKLLNKNNGFFSNLDKYISSTSKFKWYGRGDTNTDGDYVYEDGKHTSRNYIKNLISAYYKRGVTPNKINLRDSPEAHKLNKLYQAYRVMALAPIRSSFSQLTSVALAGQNMLGNPLSRIGQMLEGAQDVFSMSEEKENFLKYYAPEVYNRGLTDYDLDINGNSLNFSHIFFNYFKPNFKSDDSFTSDVLRYFGDDKKGMEAALAPLAFFDRMAARITFFAAYRNYAQEHGIPVLFGKPDEGALNHALNVVRHTQASGNQLYKSGVMMGLSSIDASEFMSIIKGNKTPHAIGEMFRQGYWNFKSFTLAEQNNMAIKMAKILHFNDESKDDTSFGSKINPLKNGISLDDYQDAFYSIAFKMMGNTLFNLTRAAANTIFKTAGFFAGYMFGVLPSPGGDDDDNELGAILASGDIKALIDKINTSKNTSLGDMQLDALENIFGNSESADFKSAMMYNTTKAFLNEFQINFASEKLSAYLLRKALTPTPTSLEKLNPQYDKLLSLSEDGGALEFINGIINVAKLTGGSKYGNDNSSLGNILSVANTLTGGNKDEFGNENGLEGKKMFDGIFAIYMLSGGSMGFWMPGAARVLGDIDSKSKSIKKKSAGAGIKGGENALRKNNADTDNDTDYEDNDTEQDDNVDVK